MTLDDCKKECSKNLKGMSNISNKIKCEYACKTGDEKQKLCSYSCHHNLSVR